MSKRAEQRALEAYSDYTINDIRLNYEEHRRVFVEGYTQAKKDFIEFVHQHYPINYVGWYQDFQNFVGSKTDTQAEKDLALTWEDMRRIHRFAEGLKEYIDDGIIVPFGRNSETFYTEVLNRFNKSREEKK